MTEQFSEQELAFFQEGDNLADAEVSVEDFSDLDDERAAPTSWVERALAILSTVRA